MHKYIYTALVVALISCSPKAKVIDNTQTEEVPMIQDITSNEASEILASRNFYYYSITSLDESSVINMANYKGKKILVVNVASKCGYTPQYAELQELHTKHGDKVQIIGFPCNQFMGQEPGSKEEIASFCQKNYGVTFPLTTKVDVKGDNQHEIYKWLTQKSENHLADYKVSWNFNKFLIDEQGNLVSHFDSKASPMGTEILEAILK
jgi:glutathione peroxidase